MAIYITRQEALNLLNKKVDKFAIKDDLATTADEEVLSTKGIKEELTKVKYPSELCECLNEFDNMYLGYKSTHPTKDINGKGLSKGLMYFNDVERQLYIFDGTQWVRTLSSVPFSIPRTPTLKKFDVEVTSISLSVATPGYDPNSVSVYLNGVRMSTSDYTATDGLTIEFTNAVYAGDVVSGFSLDDSIVSKFDVEVTTPTSTVTIPTGYDPKTLNLYLNGIRMSVDDYDATDGSTITFKTPPLAVNDVVSGFSLQVTPLSASIITEYDKIEDAPNPTINGSLGWDRSRQQLFFYSATSGAWIGKGDSTTQGDIQFYDKFEEFPDKTIAKLDTLYVDRDTKAMYFFDGTAYQRHGFSVDEPLPPQGTAGTLYIDTEDKKIRFWNGVAYETMIEGGDEIQKANSTGEFIASGREKLFIDTSSNIAYHYNGFDFVPLASSGVGGVKTISDTSEVQNENTAYYMPKNGKMYYKDEGATKRLNKEIWRVANDEDLVTNAIRDEDFIYLVDTTNILKKWDNAHSRFETLGTSKVIHTFLKASEMTYIGEYPTKAEVENAIAPKGYTDMLVWGSGDDRPSDPPKWVYSVDENGEALLVYAEVEKHCQAYALSNSDQDIGNNQLVIKVLGGNHITIKDGNGATMDFGDLDSNIRLSSGQGLLSVYIGGVKVPNHFITLAGDTVTIDTSKVISDSKIYKDTYIEISK